MLVVVVDVVSDGLFQLFGGAVNASSELLFGEVCEPAFDQVQPRGRGWGEVQVEARPLGQPVMDQIGLVGAVVVQDQVDVQLRRYVLFDGVEEVAELDGPVAALELADDLAGFGVERCEQAGGAVAKIIVRAAFGLSGAHGQQGSGALQRLDLALFVDA